MKQNEKNNSAAKQGCWKHVSEGNQYTPLGGLHPQPGSGSPSGPSGQGASRPGTP